MCTPADIYSWLQKSRNDSQREPTSEMADNVGEGSVAVLPIVQEISYELLEDTTIGMGGFSNVYEARKKRKSRKVSIRSLRRSNKDQYPFAAKVCELNPANTELSEEEKKSLSYNERKLVQQSKIQVSKLEELEAEVEMLKSLQGSQYVVHLVDAFCLTPTEQVFVIMEKLIVDVGEVAKKGLFDKFPEYRKAVLRMLLQGLQYLKLNRVVHRDIKTHNLMLSTTGQVKICDFGTAERIPLNLDKLIVPGPLSGSVEFMAPELFLEGQEYDYGVDLWAFGLVMFTLYNGGVTVWGPGKKQRNRFDGYLWSRWAMADECYYTALLGSKYLSQDERDEFRALQKPLLISIGTTKEMFEEHAVEDAELDVGYNHFFYENVDAIEVIRRCTVPQPLSGPTSEVTRTTEQKRATVETALEMEYFGVAATADVAGFVKEYVKSID